MGAIWIPANIGVVDETLVPHKGRKNPHHVFIMRKPHPHGIKNWSLVDFSGYFVAFSQYRRDGVPEPTHETLLRMSNQLPEGALVVADSYFGSVRAMEGLAKQGKHSLFSCNQSRPSMFFKNDLCSQITQHGDCQTLYGEVDGLKENEKVYFLLFFFFFSFFFSFFFLNVTGSV